MIEGAKRHATHQPPFPWFGGKSKVSHIVWERFGDVPNYVEPFAGSLAVLLGRPHPPKVETVNDLDGMVANFWRALAADVLAGAAPGLVSVRFHAALARGGAALVRRAAREHGLIVNAVAPDAIRIAPPLTLTDVDVRDALDRWLYSVAWTPKPLAPSATAKPAAMNEPTRLTNSTARGMRAPGSGISR